MNIESIIKILVAFLLILFFLFRYLFLRYYKKFSYKFLIKYLVIIFLLIIYFSRIVDFAIIPLNPYLRMVLGLIIVLSGYSLFFISHQHLGKNWSAILNNNVSKTSKLIKTGPYKYIRHPMYSASFISVIGFGILTSNWLIFLISFLILLIFYIYKISKEERFLKQLFKKDYLDYKKMTGGFFPKLK